MNSIHHPDAYFENPSSPSRRTATYQPQSLNQANSRQPAGFDQQQNGLFYMEDAGPRFDAPRYNDRLNPTMPPPNSYGYEGSPMPQAWNNSGFGHNSLAALGATTRRPSGRERRAGIPQVGRTHCADPCVYKHSVDHLP